MTATLLAQTGASLVAVLFVAWLAKALKLGGDPRIADASHAIRLAEEAETGFSGIGVARDRAGFAALVDDGQGRMMLVRAHGAHFAARALDAQTIARLDKHLLIIDTGDRRFGTVTLNLGPEASIWASRMRTLAPSRSSSAPTGRAAAPDMTMRHG